MVKTGMKHMVLAAHVASAMARCVRQKINMAMLKQIQQQLISELTGEGGETLRNTPVTFSMQVERLHKDEGYSLLDALMHMVEEHQLDPDQVPKLITPGLKQRLAYETGIEKPGVALPL